MPRFRTPALVVATATTLLLLSASTAEAQVFVGPGGPTPLAPRGPWPTPAAVPSGWPGAMTPPYSYYVTLPYPARGYVGLGPHDTFAYYGRPYGRPNDPWSWTYMQGYPYGVLARYYYPPLR